MENSEYNKIDDYLLGRLEGDALERFEQQLQIDMNLAKKVSRQKEAMELLHRMGDMEMKREVQEVQSQFKKKNQSISKTRNLKFWIAAAAVLLFLLVSFWGLQRPATMDQLITDYYAAYDVNFGDRTTNDSVEIKLAEAGLFYRQRDYAKALSIFETLTDKSDGKLQLAIGISYFELGKYKQALTFFNQLIEAQDPVFQYHGRWYAALTHLKSGDIEKTKMELNQLVQAKNANGVYKQTEAEELLKKLLK